MLVGRGTEQAALARRVAHARRGRGGAVLLTGEPGVGKTALISAVCARTRGVTVLRANGAVSEASLPFSVLADVTRPLLDLMDEIPPPQASALRGALALGPGGPADRFAAFAGALSLLAAGAGRAPLLVCIDDAHWLDPESAGAFSFCARRIYADPILIVLTARDGEPLAFDTDPFEPMALRGLDPEATAQLLSEVSGLPVDPGVAKRLQGATAGNPLALRELGRLLSRAQLAGHVALDEPLPISAGIARLFSRQVAEQPSAVRHALLLSAANTSSREREIERALEACGSSREPLDAAAGAGLVTIKEGRIEFKHPLLRAVVYRAATPAERRGAHRVLAAAASGADASLRRAWHRADATAGTDEEVADELERLATEMLARTGFAAAADALERAATLSERDEDRARRLLGAARSAQLAGLFDRAREAVRAARECSAEPVHLAECAHVEGSIELYAGDVLKAHRVLLEAAEAIAPHDPAREAQLLADSCLPLFNAGEIRRALELAELGRERAERVGGQTAVIARKLLGGARILHGQAPEGYPLMLEGLEAEERRPLSMAGELLAQWGALASLWVEDYARARAIGDVVLPNMRAAGALSPLPYSLAVRSELEFRTGDWGAALVAASEADSIAREIGQKGTGAYSWVTLARVEAPMGREESCRAHVHSALKLANEYGADSIRTYAGAALGLLELGLSRPAEASEHLREVAKITLGQGLREPGVVCWQPDLIEADIRLGELDRAEEALSRLEREAQAVGRTWALAAVARYRGLLAPDGAFERLFERALELHQATPTPFDLARTELCLGERLRRAGERRAARERLTQALERFRRLGAEPWVARAEAELGAAGARRVRASSPHEARSIQDILSAQELQVAIAVSEGKSNKEVAAALFLSPKTIEFHLGHIYRKLGVRSRTQLAQKMARIDW